MPTARPPIPIDTTSSSTTSRKTRSPATSEVRRTDREARAREEGGGRVQGFKGHGRGRRPQACRQERRQGQEPLHKEGPSQPHFPWHPHCSTTEDLSKDP